MIIASIEGATRRLGKSQGFLTLPVRDVMTEYGPFMQSAWEPTPAELVALNSGALLILEIMGTAHPPVRLSVGQPPEHSSEPIAHADWQAICEQQQKRFVEQSAELDTYLTELALVILALPSGSIRSLGAVEGVKALRQMNCPANVFVVEEWTGPNTTEIDRVFTTRETAEAYVTKREADNSDEREFKITERKLSHV